MQITSQNNHMIRRNTRHQAASRQPSDQVTLGSDSDKMGFIGLGLATGAIGVGVPTALGMGAAKSFMSGNPLLGTGLAVATLVTSPLIPFSFMPAAMSTDSGEGAGLKAYFAGAGLAAVGAGLAIF